MYYHRDLEERLIKSFDNHRITVVIGPRQSGKTTLIKELHDTCRLPRLYIDLDIWENQSVFQSYSEAVNFLGFHGYRKNTPFVVFLDEIQAVANISNTLKNLHDQELSLKIFATGSSSLEIFRHFRESLAGRKEIFHLYPLNFQEYMAFKDADLASRILSIPLSKIPGNIRQKMSLWLKEFFVFGGYPEVALTPETESKKEIIRNIFDLFVKKDLIAHLNIKNPQTALNILRYIAINMGNVLNYSDICTSLQVDVNTLKRYLMLLNETFVLKTLPPFYTNKNKEIVRAPKIYFVDAGARNYFLKNFTGIEERNDAGFLAEEFVFSQYLKKSDFLTEIKYWRDKNGREIDFVIQRENFITAYEVKAKQRITRKDVSHLLYFKKNYPEVKTNLVNWRKPQLNITEINEIDFLEM